MNSSNVEINLHPKGILAVGFSRDCGKNYMFGSHTGVGDNSVSNHSKPYDKDILLRNLRTKLCCIAPVK